jgi:hypothetical protein
VCGLRHLTGPSPDPRRIRNGHPPGLPHAFGAAPATTTDLLVVAAPGIDRFDNFRRLGRMSRGEETFADLLTDQERYDVHFVDDTLWRSVRAR